MSQTIKLGTRPSPLALIQAEQVKTRLLDQFPSLDVVIVPIKTEGDKNQSTPLNQLGGKGVFIKTLEEHILNHTIDAAVHSFKDITASISNQTQLATFLHPESIEDCVFFKDNSYSSLNQLPAGARIGSSSLRRKTYLNTYFPDLVLKDIRGNVETRLEKCKKGQYDAVILSKAGVIRLGIDEPFETLDKTRFVPAPGQGVVTVQLHNQSKFKSYFKAISNSSQTVISTLEFLFLQTLCFNCNEPLGLCITIQHHTIKIHVKWVDKTHNMLQEKIIECDTKDAENEIKALALLIKKTA